MKRFLTTLVTALFALAGYSQHIDYQNSFEQAIAKAKAKHKLLFVNIYVNAHPVINGKQISYKSGLDSPKVAKFYNKNFINFRVSMLDSAAMAFRSKYKIVSFPTYLFFDGNNNLVYRELYTPAITKVDKYITMGNKALAIEKSGRTLSSFESRYNKGVRNATFLKDYIQMREDLEIYDNAGLIDEYVDNLTIKSLNDYNQILFILKAGPYAYGKTYNLIYTNKKTVDSIYKKEPYDLRVAINNRIINNTIDKAIKDKNLALAQQAARFASTTYSHDYRRSSITMTGWLLRYYYAVKDTASYLHTAIYYYDGNYMNISADSANKIDQKNMDIMRKKFAVKQQPGSVKKMAVHDSLKKNAAVTQIRYGEPFSSRSVNSTATTLNNAAYTFYKLGTHNQNYLTKAMLWSKRSIELSPKSAYYDTLAHILYRLGFYDEAAATQSQAISLAQKTNGTVDYYKSELNKIKQRQL